MRLISVKTFEIQEFFGDKIPKYAILSHRWGDEEVTLHDMKQPTDWTKAKEGFKKIEYTCRQAERDYLGWAWVDTCCIDKTSSAELSEAINSMYQWYMDSARCYAYLSDVPAGTNLDSKTSAFKSSQWFTRGWTLQELTAPYDVIFYSQEWSYISNKHTCSGLLQDITGIPENFLNSTEVLNQFSVAQRMSWAANRNCTRVEDIAYSLLGILNINMPLLYGEGEKAFVRLQEEIWRETDDHSLLTWTVPPESPRAWTLGSIFAESPADFASSGDICVLHEELGDPSLLTKKGLQMTLCLREVKYPETSHLYWRNKHCLTFHATLNCTKTKSQSEELRRIVLLVVRSDPEDIKVRTRSYSRFVTPEHIFLQENHEFRNPDLFQTVYFRKQILPMEIKRFRCTSWQVFVHFHNILVTPPSTSKQGVSVLSKPGGYTLTWLGSKLSENWNEDYHFLLLPTDRFDGFHFAILLQADEGRPSVVLICGVRGFQRKVCLKLVEWKQNLDNIDAAFAASSNAVNYVDADSDRGDLKQTQIEVNGRQISVRLHLEDKGKRGGEVIGNRKHYIIIFKFGID